MATFHFDLVSPEKLLFAGDVGQVDLPGSEGDLGVLAGHAPLVTALRPGIITVFREAGDLRIVVNGGFAGEIKDTQEDLADATEDRRRDKLANRLDQLKALQAALSH
jgi:F-type H+-transporting ATPase subunit epsilon